MNSVLVIYIYIQGLIQGLIQGSIKNSQVYQKVGTGASSHSLVFSLCEPTEIQGVETQLRGGVG